MSFPMVVLACNIIVGWIRARSKRSLIFLLASFLASTRRSNFNLAQKPLYLKPWRRDCRPFWIGPPKSSEYLSISSSNWGRREGAISTVRLEDRIAQTWRIRVKKSPSPTSTLLLQKFATLLIHPWHLHENWQGVSSLHNKSSYVSAGQIRIETEYESNAQQ